MTNYGLGKDRVIEAGGLPLFRLLAVAVVGLFILICLSSAVARVPAGNVGVLTLFGPRHRRSAFRRYAPGEPVQDQ